MFTSFLLVEVDVADGGTVSDYLHPEWPNIRFFSPHVVSAGNPGGPHIAQTQFAATGPSSRALHFTVQSCRLWSFGLTPLGWAKFVGAPAHQFANGVFDGNTHPAFASFRPLATTVFGPEPDADAELARICAHFSARAKAPVPDADRILAIHAALMDNQIDTVEAFRQRVAMSSRTLERWCYKVFGFPPKLLLRRKRFMRSLSDFMLAPTLKWIDTLDGQYHDQAQFVREFRQFMGMSPRQYAALGHPILGHIVAARAHFAGTAVQALFGPARMPAPPLP